MLDFENFSWGIILGIFAVVILLGAVFAFSVGFNFNPQDVPLYTLLGFNVALIFLEGGLAVYILGVQRGTFYRGERMKNLLMKLNSVKNARKDVEKGFFKRKFDKESRDEITRDLKKKELELQNQIDLLRENHEDEEEELGEEVENSEETEDEN